MKPQRLLQWLAGPLLTAFFLTGCKKEPYKMPYENIGAYVLGKETCKGNDLEEYWLIDCTVYPDSPQVGTTLTFNGTTYTNVVKVKGLHQGLQQAGMRVSLDYETITPDLVASTNCQVAAPSTYLLKELFIINQGEIR